MLQMMRNIPNFIIKFYRKIELTFLRITRYFVKIKVVSGNGQYLLTATSNTLLPSFFLRLILYGNRIIIKFLVSPGMSQMIHEIAKRKLSQKKVETGFFWIKMVLLIFTAIIEAPKYSF